MATGDVYRLSVTSTFTGTDNIVNVFHYRQTADGGAEPNKAVACIEAFGVSVSTEYLACIPNSISLSLYACRGVYGSVEEAEVSATLNGTAGAGDVLPLQSAAIVSWRTGQSGRRRRGRTYLPPLTEAWQHAGNILEAQLPVIEAFATAVKLTSTGEPTPDEFEMVIFSPEDLAATPPRVGTLITPVTAHIVREVIGTQRRRRQGSGS